MSDKSKIEWTDATWNPLSGCTKISPGCDNCYAEKIAERFRGTPAYPNGFDLTYHHDRLNQPMRWKRPRRIFVNSMSDLFHKDVEQIFKLKVFNVMRNCHWHTYQLLTKRSSLMRDFINEQYDSRDFPRHIWLGVSVESAQQKSRIKHLQDTNCAVRFLSIEPLLSPIGELDLTGISWVIVGGESGAGARPMHPAWVREVRDQCVAAGVPFFFKQWGVWRPMRNGEMTVREVVHLGADQVPMVKASKLRNGRDIDGREWNQYPEAA